MEALVAWGLEVFLQKRWIPEHLADEAAKRPGKSYVCVGANNDSGC
jgi:hypothetical protein